MDIYPSSMIAHAEARQQTLLTIAAGVRPIAGNQTNRNARPAWNSALRQFLGSVLVTLGTRLQVQTDMSAGTGSLASLRGAH